MNHLARREYGVLIVVAMVFLLFLMPSLLHARREARDGIRRNEITAFKQLLEQHFNKHATYPLEFNAAPHRYVVTSTDEIGATAWYLQARLENEDTTHSAYDAEEGHNFHYRIIREGNETLYEVCGGTPRCEVTDPRS